MYSLIFCLFAYYWFIDSFFTYISSIVMLVACIFFCNKVCLINLKKKSSSRYGMPRLIPTQPSSRNLNSNVYSVWSSIFKNSLSQDECSFFPCTIREWNLLPEDISTLPNLYSFKKTLVEWLQPWFVLMN